jgi:hypothetical protein
MPARQYAEVLQHNGLKDDAISSFGGVPVFCSHTSDCKIAISEAIAVSILLLRTEDFD